GACGSRAQPAGDRGPSRRADAAGRASFVEETARDRTVRVDPAVAKERPVAADRLLMLPIAGDDQRLFLVARRLGDHLAERIGDEAAAPELEPVAADAGQRLVADAVDGRDVDAVGDRVGALGRLPGRRLARAVRGLLRRVP